MTPEEPRPWSRWTLVALSRLSEVQAEGRADSELAVLQEVAAQFADRFDAADRVYEGIEPAWHAAVRQALAELREAGLVGGDKRPTLTEAGRARAAEAVTEEAVTEEAVTETESEASERSTADGASEQSIEDRAGGQLVTAGVIAQPLRDKAKRQSMAFPSGGRDRVRGTGVRGGPAAPLRTG